MTPEAQRIAIAEACGWRLCPSNESWPNPYWADPKTRVLRTFEELPNYLNDLNAMHEAEKLIYNHNIYDMRERYLRSLAELLTNATASDLETYEGGPHFGNIFLVTHATAAQRAEAFLRTLNLWTP